MNKKFLYVANWKMYWTFDQTLTFVTDYYEKLIELAEQNNTMLILCPSSTVLYPLGEMFKSTQVKLGAQDCSGYTKGAYTGQISAESYKSLGCTYGIVGHSERRKWCGETSLNIASKCVQLLDNGLIPIICIGETKQNYDDKMTLMVLEEQLDPLLSLIKEKMHTWDGVSIIIAYEPVWAIGAGIAASTNYVDTIFTWLAKITTKIAPAIHWQFLYGGSITSTTVTEFKKLDRLNGFLIGGASLDFQELKKIVHFEMKG